MKAATKDILRTMKREIRRFLSLTIITALGVIMLTGLKAGCEDLQSSAEQLYKSQNLFDICIQSTLGLTEEDVDAIQAIPGVSIVEGTYSEEVYTTALDKQQTAEMRVLSENGLSSPYILEGTLPKSTNEIAVTQNYITNSGKNLGDSVTIIEKTDQNDSNTKNESENDSIQIEKKEEKPNYLQTEYIITAIVIDATDINTKEGAASFRSTSSTDYVFFITPKAVDYEVYSALYIKVADSMAMSTYSDEYTTLINKVIKNIEKNCKEEREQARTSTVRGEAQKLLDDAKVEADIKFADAEKEISDGEKELADGWKDWQEGNDELTQKEADAKHQFENAENELKNNYEQISIGEMQLTEAEAVLEVNSQFMPMQQLEAARMQLTQQRQILETSIVQLDAGKAELEKQKKETTKKFDEAKQKLADSKIELEDAENELAEGKKELQEKRKEANEAIADAQKEIDEIADAVWYIQDRTCLSGYVNIDSDTTSIKTIGKVFPVIFLIVAVLVCLTTVTRMVEEERGLFGTYKALGFTDSQIRKKYVLFAGGASLLGSLLGDIGGFIILPQILFKVFSEMYQLPKYFLTFDWTTGIGGIALFTISILIATYISCHEQMKQMPASLMRPDAPKAGKDIILEKIPLVWKHLSFLNKVTARNLFRYKKRLFMTIGGIMGCTSLLVCGFAIKNSISDLLPGQYDDIYRYDILAVASEPENLFEVIHNNSDVAEYLEIYTTNIKLIGKDDNSESVQLIVIPDDASLHDYIALNDESINAENEVSLSGITVTKNLSVVLNFSKDEELVLQNMELVQKNCKVDSIVTNYLGNMVYMKHSYYVSLFGDYEYNAAFINCSSSCQNQPAFADKLAETDGIISAVSTKALKDGFNDTFALINVVVYIIIGMAAGLAFVVLFTLSTTNISERERELSTIKVLGFFDREVHLYVNKETMILTGIGIILGLPVGSVLGHALTSAIHMSSIYFAVSIHPVSFTICSALALLFAIIVNLLTNRFVDCINPVEALKSVE